MKKLIALMIFAYALIGQAGMVSYALTEEDNPYIKGDTIIACVPYFQDIEAVQKQCESRCNHIGKPLYSACCFYHPEWQDLCKDFSARLISECRDKNMCGCVCGTPGTIIR